MNILPLRPGLIRKTKPAPLLLHQSLTLEPNPHLVLLQSAMPIANPQTLQYPTGIHAPHPTKATKLTYDAAFLLQFRDICTWKMDMTMHVPQPTPRPSGQAAAVGSTGTFGHPTPRPSRQVAAVGSTGTSGSVTNRWVPRGISRRATASIPSNAHVAATPCYPHTSPSLVEQRVSAAFSTLTASNVETVAAALLDIIVDACTMRQVAHTTFETAVTATACPGLCAKLYRRIVVSVDISITDEMVRGKNGRAVGGGSLFRKYLLGWCQTEFDRGWGGAVSDKERQRYLGVVRFNSELFMVGILSERNILGFMERFLGSEGGGDVPEDMAVLSLAMVVSTAGGKLDSSKRSRSRMNLMFTKIGALIENPGLNNRMRAILIDLVDQRRRRNEVTKTLDEVGVVAQKLEDM